MILYTTIRQTTKKNLLVRGLILATLGSLLLFCMGTFASIGILSSLGFPTFVLSMVLIGWGLIPYRKYVKLETHPHQIYFEKTSLTFVSNRGNQITISYNDISDISFIDSKYKYGILLKRKGSGMDIHLPYFLDDPSLHEIVHPDQTNEPF